MYHEFFKELIQTLNASWAVTLLISLALAIVSGLCAKFVVLKLYKMASESANLYDDLFFQTRLDRSFVNLTFVLVLYSGITELGDKILFISKVFELLLVYLFLHFFMRLISFLNQIYETKPISKKRPLKGVGQLANILSATVALILFISLLLDESPMVLLSGLGALSAVLMLIFKETIVSFVSGIQITLNNMIELEDWITVPELDIDGEVIEISLHFVKVRNFDKTITMVQMSKLASSTLFNWRGMYETKGRRIKRSLNFNVESVTFADEEFREKLAKEKKLAAFLESREPGKEGRDRESGEMTNLGLFRRYASFYLRSLETIRQDMLIMVRHMCMTAEGVPVEIYAFANTTEWDRYEQIQGEIFEHLFAVSAFFGLEVFQNPSARSFNPASLKRVRAEFKEVSESA